MVNDNRLAKRVTYITFSRHAMEELIRLAPKNDVLYLGGDISPEELEAMGAPEATTTTAFTCATRRGSRT